MRTWPLLVPVLAVALSATPAGAQSSEEARASALFEKGAAAYAKGELVAAAHAFEQADATLPNAAAAYNAGIAWQEGGERARAATAFERALTRGELDATRARDAESRLGELRKLLARLRVEAPRGRVTLGHLRDAAVPVTVFVEPGSVLVELNEPGGRVRERRLSVSAGADESVTFTDEATPPARAPSGEPAADVAPSGSGQRTWGWVAIGTGVAASGAAVYLGARALAARDEFDDSGHTDADARDRAESLRLFTNVAWGAAIVAGGTGVVLLLTAPSERSTALVIGPGNVALRGRF